MIKSLEGIESFVNVGEIFFEKISLSDQSQLNVSNFNNLVKFSLFFLNFDELDYTVNINLSSNQNLKEIAIYNDESLSAYPSGLVYPIRANLSGLNINNTNALEILYCTKMRLSALDISTNVNLEYLDCSDNFFTILDVSNSVALETLNCQLNDMTSLVLSTNNSTLLNLKCHGNPLVALNFSVIPNLITLNCSYNSLTELLVDNMLNLSELNCGGNQLTELNLSDNINLTSLQCHNNLNLTAINLKNGNNVNFTTGNHFGNLPLLASVCVDDVNLPLATQINSQVGHPFNLTSYCTLSPRKRNEINGKIRVDTNTNGCDASDAPIANIMVSTTNGTDSFGTFTQADGSYVLYTNDGNFNTTATTNLPAYVVTTPNIVTTTFVGFNNTDTIPFCVASNQTINDVNITIIPTIQARPGFDSGYQLVYKNVGTTALNGTVVFEFDNTKLNFLTANPTTTTQMATQLTFNYINLTPFETRTIDLEFNVMAPPTVNIGDILNFTATVNPVVGDNTPNDNVIDLNQVVIGSYDPNDIKCLEGEEILIADASKYLHYVIRFQNTGTASAINVVVANELDAKLDWDTFKLESSSDANRVVITNDNKVEYIFENINLPDSTTDEAGSHGFIAYKIKPKNTVVVGDIFESTAGIFFDFNTAITTNTATTEIVNVLAVSEYSLSNYSIYPNPTSGVLQVQSNTKIVQIEVLN